MAQLDRKGSKRTKRAPKDKKFWGIRLLCRLNTSPSEAQKDALKTDEKVGDFSSFRARVRAVGKGDPEVDFLAMEEIPMGLAYADGLFLWR